VFEVRDNGSTFIFADDTGVLGIGTATPSDALEVVGTVSGSTVYGAESLRSSGTLVVEGAATFGSTVSLNSVTYTFPGADATAPGKVLTSDAAGTLSWSDPNNGSGDVLFLAAQYPHSTYFSSGAAAVGQLLYDYDTSNNENHYRWQSSKGTVNDYWISARVRVPDNFSNWDPHTPVQYRYRTGNASNAVNHTSVRMIDTGGTDVSLSNNAALANTSWTTATITGPESGGTFTAGGYITLLVKLATDNTAGAFADAGYFTLNWSTTNP